jgi:hypothetical protein
MANRPATLCHGGSQFVKKRLSRRPALPGFWQQSRHTFRNKAFAPSASACYNDSAYTAQFCDKPSHKQNHDLSQ